MNKEVEIVKFIKTTLCKIGDGRDETNPIRTLWQYWDFDGKLIFEIDTFTKEVRFYE